MDQNLLHQRRVFPNPLGILSNIVDFILRAEFLSSSSNANGTNISRVDFETASVLAMSYPPKCYKTKIYISNKVSNGCNISWYRL